MLPFYLSVVSILWNHRIQLRNHIGRDELVLALIHNTLKKLGLKLVSLNGSNETSCIINLPI